jgi:hypothetical protein
MDNAPALNLMQYCFLMHAYSSAAFNPIGWLISGFEEIVLTIIVATSIVGVWKLPHRSS